MEARIPALLVFPDIYKEAFTTGAFSRLPSPQWPPRSFSDAFQDAYSWLRFDCPTSLQKQISSD